MLGTIVAYGNVWFEDVASLLMEGPLAVSESDA